MTPHARVFRAIYGSALALVALCWCAPVAAATLDEPETLIDGADAIVRLHFDVRVQYQRHAPSGTADLVEIYFQMLGGGDSQASAGEERVAAAEQGRVPAVTVALPVQPGAQVKKVVVRFSRKLAFKVRAGPTTQSIDIVFPGLMGAAGAPAVEEHDRYAITLQIVPLDQQDKLRPVPGRFQDYTVFSTHGWQGGRPAVELDLGYFDTEEAAQKVARSAQREFPDAKVFDVVKRKEETLAQVAAAAGAAPPPAPVVAPPAPPAPAPLPEVPVPALPVVPPAPALPAAVPEVSAPQSAAPAAPETPDTDIDKQARALLEKARSALASGNNDVAINALNQLLLLPPNKFSQDAQELIGVARERAGDIEQARKEYELYLKLFPTGEGATRVRQRLANLAPPAQGAAMASESGAKGSKYGVSGSLSQYYYGGKTQVNTTFLPGGVNTANQGSLTSTSQSSLVTTLDVAGRYRDGSNDARLVLRDSNNKSFIEGTPGANRLDSAYVDYRNSSYGISAKLGRQSGVTGGLVGRFDGAVVGYDLSPKWRVGAAVGVPTDVVAGTGQHFEGVNLEALNLWDHWGGDAFFINQSTEGVTDRRAIGGDLRYFDAVRTLYTMFDYDVNFMALNAVTLQATWQLPDQTSISLLADDRKAPELLASNAEISCGASSIGQLQQQGCLSQGSKFKTPPSLTMDQVLELAQNQTASAKQVALTVSRPLGASWQGSVDARLSNIGALPALLDPTCVGTGGTNCQLPASQGTGNVWTYDLQMTGTNLYSRRDINSFTVSHLSGPDFKGNQVGYSNLTGFLGDRMTIEPSLRYYAEDNANGHRLTRISPALRATYKVLQHLSVETQLMYERSKTDGQTQNDTTSNTFYYLGYRYDLQ